MTHECELLDVDEIQGGMKERTLKQTFGEIRDFAEMAQKFTFYNPVTYHLVADMSQTSVATDMISYTLACLLDEHPLVITDLANPIFTWDASLLLTPEQKMFRHKLYAVPTEIWHQAKDQLEMLTIFDTASHRLNVLSPRTYTIPNPFRSRVEEKLSVELFVCFGNYENYFFQESLHQEMQGEFQLPRLSYHPPVLEFLQLANHILSSLHRTNRREESNICDATDRLQSDPWRTNLIAVRQENRLRKKLETPLEESQLSPQQRVEYRDLIRYYESIFGHTAS